MASSHIISAMQAKYPQADFAAYFAFIIACAATPQPGPAHRHHIAPKEQFPELAKDAVNLIIVTVENHKQAHRLLAQCEPKLRIATAQFIAAAHKGGKLAGFKKALAHITPNVIAKRGIGRSFNHIVLPEIEIIQWHLMGLSNSEIARRVGATADGRMRANRIRMFLIRSGIYRCAEAQQMANKIGWKRKGGLIAGQHNATLKQGVCSVEAQAKSRHNRWHIKRSLNVPTCSLCQLLMQRGTNNTGASRVYDF